MQYNCNLAVIRGDSKLLIPVSGIASAVDLYQYFFWQYFTFCSN